MKKVTLRALLAIGVMAFSGAALAAGTVTLINDGLHSGSGTTYSAANGNRFVTTEGTWTWDGTVASMIGSHDVTWQVPPTPTLLLKDHVTGTALNPFQIDTGAQTTTANTYSCEEGPFGAGAGGVHSCGNFSANGNGFESTISYNNLADGNAIGDANCINLQLGGAGANADTLPGGANWTGARGLMAHDGRVPNAGLTTACVRQSGAYGDWTVYENNLGGGGDGALILGNLDANQNKFAMSCFTDAKKDGACGNATWLTFVPVPGAAWLFGSALGLLGLRRRFTA